MNFKALDGASYAHKGAGFLNVKKKIAKFSGRFLFRGDSYMCLPDPILAGDRIKRLLDYEDVLLHQQDGPSDHRNCSPCHIIDSSFRDQLTRFCTLGA